jgi:hypothetical protein
VLKYLVGDSASDLLKQIEALGPLAQPLAIYGLDHRHHAWVKISKKEKGTK